MAMVNTMLNLAVPNPNVKDSRWLTLEVCREFQRNKCTRTENECKFAHPPLHVEVQNGRVIACFDSIKGKCQRKDPPCKYLHPPQHLREQLLQNGRNNLILRNLQLQAAQAAVQPYVPNVIPLAGKQTALQYPATVLPTGHYPLMAPPYMGSIPTSMPAFNPYLNASMSGTVALPGSSGEATMVTQQIPGVIPTPLQPANQKVGRPDRLEVCREFQRGTCTRQPSECRFAHPPDNVTVDQSDNHVTVCMDFIKGKCTRDLCRYFHPPTHLQAQIKAAQQRANAVAAQNGPSQTQLPQVVEVLTAGKKRPRDPTDDLVLGAIPGIPYKRMAMTDAKSGIPMTYQPATNMLTGAYHHAALMQLGQQPYIPVTYPFMVAPAEAVVTAPACAPPIPSNAASVAYFDDNKQLRDTLPVCRDFKSGQCDRPQCKYVHLLEEYVEVMDGHVTVCRDSVRGKCQRPLCKYYHIAVILPPAS